MPLIGKNRDLMRTWAPGSSLHSILHSPDIKSIVVISAHHESDDGSVLVMNDLKPKLLFDYSGFPPETYEYTLPNPGEPSLAARVTSLLSAASIPTRTEPGRGHDHGVFVPLLALEVASKRPTLPIVSVSLRGPAAYRTGVNLNSLHWEMGRALAPLRNESVLLLGSGNTYHGRASPAEAASFDEHLRALAEEQGRDLRRWEEHAAARKCHPRPEHLLPLLVCAGAAEAAGAVAVESSPHDFMGKAASHFVFR
jgi:aromatic ring-opening dioxygenase catalytic subunit (LigB family)